MTEAVTVYMLTHSTCPDDEWVIGIFSTMEKACDARSIAYNRMKAEQGEIIESAHEWCREHLNDFHQRELCGFNIASVILDEIHLPADLEDDIWDI